MKNIGSSLLVKMIFESKSSSCCHGLHSGNGCLSSPYTANINLCNIYKAKDFIHPVLIVSRWPHVGLQSTLGHRVLLHGVCAGVLYGVFNVFW